MVFSLEGQVSYTGQYSFIIIQQLVLYPNYSQNTVAFNLSEMLR